MAFSEREYLTDPTLLKTRFYDKLNPVLEGYEEYNRERGLIPPYVREKMEQEAQSSALEAPSKSSSARRR